MVAYHLETKQVALINQSLWHSSMEQNIPPHCLAKVNIYSIIC